MQRELLSSLAKGPWRRQPAGALKWKERMAGGKPGHSKQKLSLLN
jgi:hypothetical protein